MAWLRNEDLLQIGKDPPGLELAGYWRRAAIGVPDSARRLLSYLTSSLASRGWLASADNLLVQAVEHLAEPAHQVQTDWQFLVDRDLLSLDQGKVVALVGLLATRPTRLSYVVDTHHELHLVGPLAALAVARALGKPGEVRATCLGNGQTRLRLMCDAHRVQARQPETIGLFLPSWDGLIAPSQASAAGGLFADDDALGAWQDRNGDPAGMPVPAMFFDMAAIELGQQVGAALEGLLNHLPDFD